MKLHSLVPSENVGFTKFKYHSITEKLYDGMISIYDYFDNISTATLEKRALTEKIKDEIDEIDERIIMISTIIQVLTEVEKIISVYEINISNDWSKSKMTKAVLSRTKEGTTLKRKALNQLNDWTGKTDTELEKRIKFYINQQNYYGKAVETNNIPNIQYLTRLFSIHLDALKMKKRVSELEHSIYDNTIVTSITSISELTIDQINILQQEILELISSLDTLSNRKIQVERAITDIKNNVEFTELNLPVELREIYGLELSSDYVSIVTKTLLYQLHSELNTITSEQDVLELVLKSKRRTFSSYVNDIQYSQHILKSIQQTEVLSLNYVLPTSLGTELDLTIHSKTLTDKYNRIACYTAFKIFIAKYLEHLFATLSPTKFTFTIEEFLIEYEAYETSEVSLQKVFGVTGKFNIGELLSNFDFNLTITPPDFIEETPNASILLKYVYVHHLYLNVFRQILIGLQAGRSLSSVISQHNKDASYTSLLDGSRYNVLFYDKTTDLQIHSERRIITELLFDYNVNTTPLNSVYEVVTGEKSADLKIAILVRINELYVLSLKNNIVLDYRKKLQRVVDLNKRYLQLRFELNKARVLNLLETDPEQVTTTAEEAAVLMTVLTSKTINKDLVDNITGLPEDLQGIKNLLDPHLVEQAEITLIEQQFDPLLKSKYASNVLLLNYIRVQLPDDDEVRAMTINTPNLIQKLTEIVQNKLSDNIDNFNDFKSKLSMELIITPSSSKLERDLLEDLTNNLGSHTLLTPIVPSTPKREVVFKRTIKTYTSNDTKRLNLLNFTLTKRWISNKYPELEKTRVNAYAYKLVSYNSIPAVDLVSLTGGNTEDVAKMITEVSRVIDASQSSIESSKEIKNQFNELFTKQFSKIDTNEVALHTITVLDEKIAGFASRIFTKNTYLVIRHLILDETVFNFAEERKYILDNETLSRDEKSEQLKTLEERNEYLINETISKLKINGIKNIPKSSLKSVTYMDLLQVMMTSRRQIIVSDDLTVLDFRQIAKESVEYYTQLIKIDKRFVTGIISGTTITSNDTLLSIDDIRLDKFITKKRINSILKIAIKNAYTKRVEDHTKQRSDLFMRFIKMYFKLQYDTKFSIEYILTDVDKADIVSNMNELLKTHTISTLNKLGVDIKDDWKPPELKPSDDYDLGIKEYVFSIKKDLKIIDQSVFDKYISMLSTDLLGVLLKATNDDLDLASAFNYYNAFDNPDTLASVYANKILDATTLLTTPYSDKSLALRTLKTSLQSFSNSQINTNNKSFLKFLRGDEPIERYYTMLEKGDEFSDYLSVDFRGNGLLNLIDITLDNLYTPKDTEKELSVLSAELRQKVEPLVLKNDVIGLMALQDEVSVTSPSSKILNSLIDTIETSPPVENLNETLNETLNVVSLTDSTQASISPVNDLQSSFATAFTNAFNNNFVSSGDNVRLDLLSLLSRNYVGFENSVANFNFYNYVDKFTLEERQFLTYLLNLTSPNMGFLADVIIYQYLRAEGLREIINSNDQFKYALIAPELYDLYQQGRVEITKERGVVVSKLPEFTVVKLTVPPVKDITDLVEVMKYLPNQYSVLFSEYPEELQPKYANGGIITEPTSHAEKVVEGLQIPDKEIIVRGFDKSYRFMESFRILMSTAYNLNYDDKISVNFTDNKRTISREGDLYYDVYSRLSIVSVPRDLYIYIAQTTPYSLGFPTMVKVNPTNRNLIVLPYSIAQFFYSLERDDFTAPYNNSALNTYFDVYYNKHSGTNYYNFLNGSVIQEPNDIDYHFNIYTKLAVPVIQFNINIDFLESFNKKAKYFNITQGGDVKIERNLTSLQIENGIRDNNNYNTGLYVTYPNKGTNVWIDVISNSVYILGVVYLSIELIEGTLDVNTYQLSVRSPPISSNMIIIKLKLGIDMNSIRKSQDISHLVYSIGLPKNTGFPTYFDPNLRVALKELGRKNNTVQQIDRSFEILAQGTHNRKLLNQLSTEHPFISKLVIDDNTNTYQLPTRFTFNLSTNKLELNTPLKILTHNIVTVGNLSVCFNKINIGTPTQTEPVLDLVRNCYVNTNQEPYVMFDEFRGFPLIQLYYAFNNYTAVLKSYRPLLEQALKAFDTNDTNDTTEAYITILSVRDVISRITDHYLRTLQYNPQLGAIYLKELFGVSSLDTFGVSGTLIATHLLILLGGPQPDVLNVVYKNMYHLYVESPIYKAYIKAMALEAITSYHTYRG